MNFSFPLRRLSRFLQRPSYRPVMIFRPFPSNLLIHIHCLYWYFRLSIPTGCMDVGAYGFPCRPKSDLSLDLSGIRIHMSNSYVPLLFRTGVFVFVAL